MSYNIPVSMIRQYCFCPRIYYFEELLQIQVRKPIWVEQGSSFHREEHNRIKRRVFEGLGIGSYSHYSEYMMSSNQLHMQGKVDMLFVTDEEVYPFEIKLQRAKPQKGQIYQMCAYGLLAEEYFDKKFNRGFFILEPRGKKHSVQFNETIKEAVLKTVSTMLMLAKNPCLPESSATVFQCNQCEYLNYCNDRNF